MFGFFKSEPFKDEALGTLNRHGQHWVGTVSLPFHGPLELRLSGDRKAPDSKALALARELPSRYLSYKGEIEKALYEHFGPYAEAKSKGELAEIAEPFPQVSSAEQVWPHVYPAHVLIEPMEGTPTIEVAYRVGWDEEHTVGARLQGGHFLELCGSV